jgi:hypothetical protein
MPYTDDIVAKQNSIRMVADILGQGVSLANMYQQQNGSLPAVDPSDDLNEISAVIGEMLAYTLDINKAILDWIDARYPVPTGGFN